MSRILKIARNFLFMFLCLMATQVMASNPLLDKVFVKEISFDSDFNFNDKNIHRFIYDNIIKHVDFEAFKSMSASEHLASWGLFENKLIELSHAVSDGKTNTLKECLEKNYVPGIYLPIGAYLIKTKTQKLWMIFLVHQCDKKITHGCLKYRVFDAETKKLLDEVFGDVYST